jgi:uncharacterized membrane protein YgcG
MKRLLTLVVLAGVLAGVLAALWLFPSPVSASTPADCLAQRNVCISSDGRGLITEGQQARLEQQIGRYDIYLVAAGSGSSGYNSSMNEIISTLSGHQQFTVGFLDTRLRHFGAYSKGMMPSHAAADIATSVVRQHQADQNIYSALTDFVTEVQNETGSGSGAANTHSQALQTLLITLGIVAGIAVLGFFVIARPIRQRRRQELKDAKSAAQDDLIALSNRLTNPHANASLQNNPEVAEEQAAALAAYERGTASLDAARRVNEMGSVSQAIATGQYHLACAEALAVGQPRPDRRPSCFFDPRHGMSASDVFWTPADGGPGRSVSACSACAHKVEQGAEPDMRKVEVNGAPARYVNTGLAPAYWGGYGFGPGLFTGFLLGEALAPHAIFADSYSSADGASDGGDYGGGDFGGGDFGGGDF